MKKILSIIVIFLLIWVNTSPSKSIENELNTEETEYWAVIVSVVDYEVDANDLNIPADMMYNSLKSAKNWNEDHIQFIHDENATKENVLNGLDWLADHADEEDIAFFFYMGHGIPPVDDLNGDESDGKDEGICTYERGGYIIDDLLNEKFNNISAKGLLAMIDCCHSAGMFESEYIAGINEELSGSGRVIIASTSEEAIALEVKGFGTVLTLSFKQIVARSLGDKNKDGIISAEETFVQLKKMNRRLNLGLFCSGFLLGLTLDRDTVNRLLAIGIASILLWQMFSYFVYGGIMIPYYPQIYDNYEGELPFIEIN